MPSVPDGAAWDLPPRASEALIADHLGDLLSVRSLRIGPGETVPEAYVQVTMRAMFLDALHRLAPQTTQDLAGDEAHEIVAQDYRALGTYLMPPHDRQPLDEAERREDRFIDAWQHQYGLPDAWLHVAAMMTMQRARDLHRHGKTFDAPLVLPGVTALADLDGIPDHRPTEIPARLNNLIITFNPRTETVDDAVKRLMPHLRDHLTAIADDDRTLNDARAPKTYRTTTAYEWLVRYQVLGESRNAIACADDIHRAHVSAQVNETAALIGLTLRKERGGRPRRIHAHNVRVRIPRS